MKSPRELTESWIPRQTGRTTDLILNLPRDRKYAVVAWSKDNAEFIRRKVREVRGHDVERNGYFIGMGSIDKLVGMDLVFIDNSVADKLAIDYISSLNRIKD